LINFLNICTFLSKGKITIKIRTENGAKTMTKKQMSWHRITGEMVLIVSSVFIAIFLESAWQEHQNYLAAKGALGQMLEELRQDRTELKEVVNEQRILDSNYRIVINWLGEPEAIPTQEFGKAMEVLAYSNLTMYPRRSAWRTMVASGQLQLLNDDKLVTKLGDLHEKLFQRLMLNATAYDDNIVSTMGKTVPTIWDYSEFRFLTHDPLKIAKLRGELKFIHVTWNRWYLKLLTNEYGKLLDELIAEIEVYQGKPKTQE